jgi:hypothetical protein
MMRGTPRPFLRSIVNLEPDRIRFRRAALVGDADFVARPHVAVGKQQRREFRSPTRAYEST